MSRSKVLLVMAVIIMLVVNVVVFAEEEVKRATASQGTPEIDGVMDEVYKGTEIVEVTKPIKEEMKKYATGKVRVLWDDEFLYVFGEIKDEGPSVKPMTVWKQDSLEIFVDENNAKEFKSYDKDDVQYRISMEGKLSPSANFLAKNVDKHIGAAKLTDGGYNVEVAIPLQYIDPKVGTVIGFDLQINDTYGPDSWERDAVTVWFQTSGNTHRWAHVFGELKLVK